MAEQMTNGEREPDRLEGLHDVQLPIPLDAPPPIVEKRHGFLPFDTNWFDRIFIGLLLLIAIHLLWMRYLEAALPLGIATLISLVLMVVIYRKG